MIKLIVIVMLVVNGVLGAGCEGSALRTLLFHLPDSEATFPDLSGHLSHQHQVGTVH